MRSGLEQPATSRPGPGPTVPSDAQLLRRLVEAADDGLAILSPDRRFSYVNPAGARILQVEADRLVGQPALVFEPAGVVGPPPRVRVAPW